MKNTLKTICSFVLMATFFISCKKDESIVTLQSATNPVLTSSVPSNTTMVLNDAQAADVAMQLSWTNPEYKLSTGISTQTVTYSLELDSTGSNFTNPNRIKTQITTADLSRNITVDALNKYVIDAQFKAAIPHDIEIRIIATLGAAGAPVYSNVLKYKITPYPVVKVRLPSSGDLFIVGSATPNDWGNPVPTPSQQFTKTSATTYEITINLKGGKYFLLLPVNGSWGSKYAVDNNSVADLWKGGEMKFFTSGGQDIPGPPDDGTYKITVDFQNGIFTVVKI